MVPLWGQEFSKFGEGVKNQAENGQRESGRDQIVDQLRLCGDIFLVHVPNLSGT